VRRKFRLLATQLALRASDRHTLASTHPQQVDLELSEGSQDVEEHLPHRISGVVYLPAEGKLDPADCERVTDRAGVRDAAGKAVQFRHDEHVAFPRSGHRLIETAPGARGAGAVEASTGTDVATVGGSTHGGSTCCG
jgi:hypothetical protein